MKHFYILITTLVVLMMCGAVCGADAKKKSKPKAKAPSKSEFDGIDISHHNGDIDWDKLDKNHKDNIKFVYIKCTEGKSWVDDKYDENVNEARKKGYRVGSYHFFSHTHSARDQFNHFSKHVKLSKQDIIPMVDIERMEKAKKPKEVIRQLKEFCRLAKNYFGVKPMIYTSQSIYNDYLAEDFKSYHLFIANYKKTAPELVDGARYTIWQYSEKGKLKGVGEHVDLDVLHPDFSVHSIAYTKKRRR